MSTDHKIFSKGIIGSNKNVVQKVKYNREQLLSKETAHELNTYLNFGIFPTFGETFMPYYENGKLVDNPDPKYGIGTPGVRSIFNRAGFVVLGSNTGSYDVDVTDGNSANSWRIANNVPLMDSPKARQRIRKSSGCSIKELVEASKTGALGQETYSYSDFMYCKHLGKVPNNYMITLRRFPLPVDDYIGATGESDLDRIQNTANQASCIGCMITWMGVSGNEMTNLLKYSVKMPFKEEIAEEQNLQEDSDQGLLNGFFSMFDEKYQQQYQDGYITGGAAATAFERLTASKDSKGSNFKMSAGPYKDYAKFRDVKTKVYGPIDSIRSTYVRDDKGLSFDQKLSLVFEYEIKSYNGINGKQAMLDLISNILNVTYTTGSFWGGGFKGYAAHQSNVFTNLNIFKARGGFTNFIEAFSKDLGTLTDNTENLLEKNGGGLKGLLKMVGKGANNFGGMMLSSVLNALGRPQKTMYNALLSPAPIGFWHVTIGNPKRPIMSIGNMIVTNVSIEHNGPLGIDDFPTGLKVTVELDRGKPRDLRDIEKLYMQGTDRIYSSMSDKVFDMYKNAELYHKHKKSGTMNEYNPIENTAEVKENGAEDEHVATVTVEDYDSIKDKMKKYFGTDDVYSIYVPAAEQEYGAGKKKPSTAANSNIVN